MCSCRKMLPQKPSAVIPAKAGIPEFRGFLDPGIRRGDKVKQPFTGATGPDVSLARAGLDCVLSGFCVFIIDPLIVFLSKDFLRPAGVYFDHIKFRKGNGRDIAVQGMRLSAGINDPQVFQRQALFCVPTEVGSGKSDRESSENQARTELSDATADAFNPRASRL